MSLLLYLRGVKHLNGPFLIVCPLSVVSGWEEELARLVGLFAKILNVLKLKTVHPIYFLRVDHLTFPFLFANFHCLQSVSWAESAQFLLW